MDLAGHERYFKTTAYGLTGHLPDYACLIVGANAGVGLTLHSMNFCVAAKPCTALSSSAGHAQLQQRLMICGPFLRVPAVSAWS